MGFTRLLFMLIIFGPIKQELIPRRMNEGKVTEEARKDGREAEERGKCVQYID